MKLARRRVASFHRTLREHYGRARRSSFGYRGKTRVGVTFTVSGGLVGRPLAQPLREYLLYLPSAHAKHRALPLVVWLHGCEQTPEEFRDGSRVIEMAEQRHIAVLMPRQSRWANTYGCWNWFDPATQNGVGESAIVLAQMREVRTRWGLDPKRTWIAGMSSGACLAACLSVHAPQEFRAAAMVSGVACGAALSSRTAMQVMKTAPQVDVAQIAIRVRHDSEPLRLPALVIQGEADEVINPAHGRELIKQLLAVNGERPAEAELRKPDRVSQLAGMLPGDLRQVKHEQYFVNGHSRVELLSIAGLGHAWSGGDPKFAFNDPGPVDATRLIFDFFARNS